MDERRTVVASQPGVAEAAAELPASASAVDRVVAGIFAAAALSPSVLMGPVQILLGGGSLGAFAIDGRVRQPGTGAQRPRGFTSADPIPEAAWVATPTMPAALAATLALVRTTTMARVVGPAIELAKERSERRAKLLRLIGRRGGATFTERDVVDELVAAFGRSAGGLLTAEDLAEPAVTAEPAVGIRVPWFEAMTPLSSDTVVHVIASGDSRGRFVVACYEEAHDGIVHEHLDVVVPRLAVPVRRGEVRVRPGTPRPAAAPMAIAMARGSVDAALGRPGREADDGLEALVRTGPSETWIMPRGIVGVVRSRDGAKPVTLADRPRSS
jgi:gamma-glutamyltranspeptidase/glutathione hydrolase